MVQVLLFLATDQTTGTVVLIEVKIGVGSGQIQLDVLWQDYAEQFIHQE